MQRTSTSPSGVLGRWAVAALAGGRAGGGVPVLAGGAPRPAIPLVAPEPR